MDTAPDRELEEWKEICEVLKSGISTGKRYSKKGTRTRLPLPTYRNFRERTCIMLSTLREWMAGGRFLREVEPVTLRPGQLEARS